MKKTIIFGALAIGLLLIGNLALAQNCTSVSVNAAADFKGNIVNNPEYFQNWTSDVQPGKTVNFQYCPPSPAIEASVTYSTGAGSSLKWCTYNFTFANNVVNIARDKSSTGNCVVAAPSDQNPAWVITMSAS